MAGGRITHQHMPFTSSTELLDFSAPGGWRTAADLPFRRAGFSGARLADTFHVVGGLDPASGPSTEIFAWDGVAESWALAGHLQAVRMNMAVTEVSAETLENYC